MTDILDSVLEEIIESSGEPHVGAGGAPRRRADVRPPRLRWFPGSTRARRRHTIRAYVGMNGSGKTQWMIKDLEPSMRAGRKILSTVPIYDPSKGEGVLYEHYERLTSWTQVLEARSTDIVFDEVLGVANARSSTGLPPQVQLMLNKLRHADNTLSWTAPAWSRADVIIREVTQGVTVCRGYWGRTRSLPGEESSRSWASKSLFRAITYDAADFTTWTDSKEGNLKGIANEWMYAPEIRVFGKVIISEHLSRRRYDTLGSVDRIGETLESGRCAHCGGRRAVPNCSCDDAPGRNAPKVTRKAALPDPLAGFRAAAEEVLLTRSETKDENSQRVAVAVDRELGILPETNETPA